MRAVDLIGGTELVPEEACWDLLASEAVGRVVVTLEGRVDVFPVNYALDGRSLVFRTNAGRKLAWATAGEVAFEVDSLDGHTFPGWSVVVHGTAALVPDEEGARVAEVRPWTGSKDFLVRITPESITGRRVLRTSERL